MLSTQSVLYETQSDTQQTSKHKVFDKYRSLTVTENIQDYQEARMNNNTDAVEKAIHIYPEIAKCQTLD